MSETRQYPNRRTDLAAMGVDVRNRDENGRVLSATKRTAALNGKPHKEKRRFDLAWLFGFLLAGEALYTHMTFGYSLTEMVTKLPENPFWCGIFILLLLQTIGAVLMELDILPGLSLLIASPGGIFGTLEVVLKACLYVLLALAAIVLFPVLILIPIITGFSVTSFVTGLFK